MMHLFQILIEMVCAICNRSCSIQHHLLQSGPACGYRYFYLLSVVCCVHS